MRIAALVLFFIAVSSGAVLAQGQPADRADPAARQAEPEEVVVRGRRVGELRLEVELKRERAYEIFNEINSSDDFDVSCDKENTSGTRLRRQVCRARFEDDISSDAAREYMATMFLLCEPTPDQFGGGMSLNTQACMFGGAGESATASAQAVEGRALLKRDQMTEEIWRVARENDEFAQAILDWYEANQQYDEARKRRAD